MINSAVLYVGWWKRWKSIWILRMQIWFPADPSRVDRLLWQVFNSLCLQLSNCDDFLPLSQNKKWPLNHHFSCCLSVDWLNEPGLLHNNNSGVSFCCSSTDKLAPLFQGCQDFFCLNFLPRLDIVQPQITSLSRVQEMFYESCDIIH